MFLCDANEWKLYDFICRNLIASLSNEAVYRKTNYNIKCGKYSFSHTSKEIINKGFLEILNWKNKENTHDFPSILKINSFEFKIISFNVMYTSPPKYLTESELVRLMFRNRIGTNGTVPNYIEKLLEKKYLRLYEGRRLKPTKLGLALIEGLGSVDESLILPHIRANIENSVNEIAKGIKTYEEVVKNSLNEFKIKLRNLILNYKQLIMVFNKYFRIDFRKFQKKLKQLMNYEYGIIY